jgi:hypothetical protein
MRVLILYVSLFTLEIIAGFFMLLFDSLNYQENVDAVILWNLWRLLFYGLPLIMLFFLLGKYLRSGNTISPLLLSIFNLIIYVSLSYLSEFIWGKNVPLPPRDIMFWTTCISIFISPIILYQIPYFKRLMKSL